MRFLLALLLAPVLLAPVRLKDATPSFFTPPAQSPAPESYSLPAAEALTTPTVIMVSPTILPASPTVVITPTSLNLPLPPSATAPQQIIIIQQPAPNLMSPLQSALCQKGMELVQQLTLLSYQQRQNATTLRLSLAASAAAGEARGRQWPNLTAFNHAAAHLPWFGQPQKAEILDGTAAARRLCEQ